MDNAPMLLSRDIKIYVHLRARYGTLSSRENMVFVPDTTETERVTFKFFYRRSLRFRVFFYNSELLIVSVDVIHTLTQISLT